MVNPVFSNNNMSETGVIMSLPRLGRGGELFHLQFISLNVTEVNALWAVREEMSFD